MKMNCRCLVLVASMLLSVGSLFALDGSWRGDITIRQTKLPLVFNFTEQDGTTSCTLDSPNQNAYGLPATVDFLSADSIRISASSIGAAFAGSLNGDVMEGVFSQSGYQFPLTLKRELPLLERRPQTPQPPFPYQTVDTTFVSSDSTVLSGTLVLPDNFCRATTPICVLITGSGPQNRDEEIFEHRPFAVIADYLARNGVATFRYDDRGTAASKGTYATSTIDTFRDDAKAALLFAKSFGTGPVGLIGHSEGGTIALLLAQEKLPDFVVSLAGMAVSGKETVLAQNKRALQQAGLDAAMLDDSMTLISELFDEAIRRTDTGEPADIDVDAIAARLGVTVPPQILNSLKGNMASAINGYFLSLLKTDARGGMSEISCPVLALNGDLDTQVAAEENLSAIEKGVKEARVVKLPGLNHLLQHAGTGDTDEYGEIRETISPEALSIILDFVKGR